MCLREDLDQKSSPRSNWAVWEYTRKSCARVVPRPLGDVPVGAYDSTRLSNIGIGHGAIDAGVGYTYLNPQTGHEFSGVLGFTYNFTNQSTQYQNGVDMHFDWGASQFLTKQFLSVLYNNQMLRAFASLRSESRSLNVPPRHASTISTLCTSI